MRNKRRIYLSGLVLVVFACALALLWQPLRLGEPWVRGKPISAWLEIYGPGPHGYKPSPEADDALRRLGPRAVPFLLSLLRATNSPANAALALPPSPIATMWLPPSTNITVTTRLNRVKAWVEQHTPIRFNRPPYPASWKHWQAYLGFQALGPLGKSAIPELAKLAHDPGGDIGYLNIEGMKNIPTIASLAYNSSTYVWVGDDWYTQRRFSGPMRNSKSFLVDGEIAGWSLSAIGAEAVPSLLELLTSDNPRLRWRAAGALGAMGAAAEPAVPPLVNLLKDPDLDARISAADALGNIARQPALVIPALIENLHDSQVAVYTYSARSLGDFGLLASNAIPILVANLGAGDYRFRDESALALGKISREATEKEVMPAELRALKNPNYSARNMAVIALGQMTNYPDLVIPALVGALDETNAMVRGNVVLLLGRFGTAARPGLPKITALTNDPESSIRENAAAAVKRIESGR